MFSRDEETNTDGYKWRELMGLDKAMQTTRGNLDFALAKVSEIDEEITDIKKIICKALEIETTKINK